VVALGLTVGVFGAVLLWAAVTGNNPIRALLDFIAGDSQAFTE